MKKQIKFTAVLLATSLIWILPGVVDAQQAVPTTITAPANGAQVGRSFTLTGSIAPRCAIFIKINGQPYVVPTDRERYSVVDPGSESAPASPGGEQADGRYSIAIDLTGSQVIETGQRPEGNGVRHLLAPLSAGRHTLTVEPQGTLDENYQIRTCGAPASVTLNVSDNSSGAATVTPTPSPSTAPVVASTPTPEVEPKGWWNDLDPQWWILIGLLLGAGLLFTLEQLSKHHWKKHKTK